jgi:hypothetical protein
MTDLTNIGLFESLEADRSTEKLAHRHSVVAANKRVQDRFASFLNASKSPSERTARLDYIRGEVKQVVADACSQYGGDPTKVESSVLRHLTSDLPWENDEDDEDKDSEEKDKKDSRTAKVAEDLGDFGADRGENTIPPTSDPLAVEPTGETINLTPNAEGLEKWLQNIEQTDPSLAAQMRADIFPEQGKEQGSDIQHVDDPIDGPRSYPRGASVREARRPKMCPYHSEVMDISLAAGDPTAGFNAMSQHAWGPQHCQGGEFDGRCNFKREMVTQEFWDNKAQQAQERREQRERQLQEQQIETPEVPDSPEGIDEAPLPDEGGINDELAEAPSAVGEGVDSAPSMGELEPMAASTKEAEALKTVDVEKDTLPTIDKRKWQPASLDDNGGTKLEPIDTEGEGSPVPTKRVDPLVPVAADRGDDFLEGTKAVTETQDVTKEWSGEGSGKTDTWSGNNGASPVTSAKVDPDVNPIRKHLEEGFVPHSEVQSAIEEYNDSEGS